MLPIRDGDSIVRLLRQRCHPGNRMRVFERTMGGARATWPANQRHAIRFRRDCSGQAKRVVWSGGHGIVLTFHGPLLTNGVGAYQIFWDGTPSKKIYRIKHVSLDRGNSTFYSGNNDVVVSVNFWRLLDNIGYFGGGRISDSTWTEMALFWPLFKEHPSLLIFS